MGSFCVSILTTNALKKVLKSNKIKKILVSTVNQSIKKVWIIPNDKKLPSDIFKDIENQLKKSFPNYTIKKEGPNKQNIKISGTRNGRIVISQTGRTNFTHIYVKNPSSKPSVEDAGEIMRKYGKLNSQLFDLMPIR